MQLTFLPIQAKCTYPLSLGQPSLGVSHLHSVYNIRENIKENQKKTCSRKYYKGIVCSKNESSKTH